MLKEKGIEKWIYEENQRIKIIKFEYKEREEPMDYTYMLASKMQSCEYEDILRYDAVLDCFDQCIIENTLIKLTF